MEKLIRIQKKLKSPKSQYNKFWKYKYRNCEDILTAVKPLLDWSILIITDDILLIWDRYYVKATVIFKDWDKEEKVTAYAREELNKKWMDCSQITWAASSYARKYALNWLFLIDDVKDADSNNLEKEDKTWVEQELNEPKEISYWKCFKCWAENAKNPKTWKIFCSKKCWVVA